MKVVRLALVDPKDSSRASLKNLLLGIDAVWLEAECSSYDYFFDVVTQTQPDIALIAIDSDPTKGLDLIAQISATRGYAPDSVWRRNELVPDDRLGPAARNENQCAR